MEFKKTPKRRPRYTAQPVAAPTKPLPPTAKPHQTHTFSDVRHKARPAAQHVDEPPVATAAPRPISSARRRSLAMPSPRSRRPKVPLVAIKQSPVHPRLASRRLGKKQLIIVSGFALLVAGGATAWFVGPHIIGGKSAISSDAAGSLEYQAVLPTGKTISQLGGWKRLSPPGGETVIAYSDTLDNIAISITQQQLPQSFQHNADEQVGELAKKFNATTKLTADNGVLYVGTSTKGPQSVILTKNNLLITIKSQEKINDASWIRYVSSLH